MKHLHVKIGLVLAAVLVGCGGGQEGASTPAEQPVEAAAAAPAPASVGSIAFAVDGEAKQFGEAPEGNNTYTKLASTILARPARDATAQISITFMSYDLKSLDYPVDLPLERKPGAAMTPQEAMANVGYSYTDDSGQEWAGPGKVHLDSFGSDGVVQGTFTDVSLPHTDKQMPNVTLTDGSFRVRIASPF